MEKKEEECVEREGLYIQTTICLCLYLDERKHVDKVADIHDAPTGTATGDIVQKWKVSCN